MRAINKLTPKKAELFPPVSKDRPAILKEAIYLDTETSHLGEEVGWIYQWAFTFCGEVAYGRKPTELLQALDSIARVNYLDHDTKCIVFVHNLSYDISYLKDYLIAHYNSDDFDILAIAPHKFITFTIGPWIFRCTFKLSNRSLAKWGKDLGIKATKKVGMIDYDLVRYQDSKLTRKDWIYMLYDVWALEECVKKEMELDGDTLQTLPLTSTAYVRRDARKEFKKHYSKNRKKFINMSMDLDLYKALHAAYAGGLTHGNRFLADKIVNGKVAHADFVSHYPTEQVAEERGYPIDKFAVLYKKKEGSDFTLKDVDKWAQDHCLIIQICISNLEIRKGVTLPYAQSVKFWQGKLSNYGRPIEDNGRILHMTGSSIVSLTEIDLKWIRKQYTFSYTILRVWSAPRGPLPDWLISTIKKYYFEKSKLKEDIKIAKKAGDSAKVADLNQSYGKSKNRLNGVYGMTATNPVRTEIYMDELGEWSSELLTDKAITEKLEKFYESKASFMTYAFGVYCTALARNKLLEFCELIGYDNFIYADTDSLFFINNDESIIERIERRNTELQAHAEQIGAYVEVYGKKVYFDKFEVEETDIQRFKFLHAKAYAYEYKDELYCTIAGVPEKGRNHKTRVKELGKLENLKEDFVFKDCGGTRCVYTQREPTILDLNGHLTEVSSSAIILPVEKTLHGLISKDEYYVTTEIVADAEVERFNL